MLECIKLSFVLKGIYFSNFHVPQLLVPLLSNKRNHENWPAVVSQDVQRHVHSLKSSVFVVAGQVKGKTLLPLPVGAESFTDTDEDK